MKRAIKSLRAFAAASLVVFAQASAGAAAAYGQGAGKTSDAAEAAEAQERRLFDLALGAGGVMAADLGLVLLENGHVRNADRRRQICESVLSRLSSAPEPYPLAFATNYGNGNREGDRATGIAYYPADALSLRCRAAAQLLDMDAEAARFALLETEPGLELPKVECSLTVIPKVDVFYRTLAAVVSRAYSADERRGGMHWDAASRYLAGIRSPVEIVPACDMIMALDEPPAVRDRFALELATAVGRLDPSPRALFHMAGWEGQKLGSMPALVESLKASPDVQRSLVDALRRFAIASLAAPRCGDLSQEAEPGIVSDLNRLVFGSRPIVADELDTPTRTGAGAAYMLWTSPVSKRMMFAYQTLNTARREMPPEADRTAWKADYLKLLGELRDWTAVSERNDYDYVAQKGQLMAGMIENAYDDATRAEAVRDFGEMMRHANAARIPDHVMLLMTVLMFSESAPATRKAMLEGLRASGARGLSVYAALQLEGVDALRTGVDPPATVGVR
ncbi:MAG: hypothetical protein IT175_04955 [Acidobacteria bacterium]|nr:hypothetical protein [Acidobacteriota bacterium]